MVLIEDIQTSSGWFTPSWFQMPFLSKNNNSFVLFILNATSVLYSPLVALSLLLFSSNSSEKVTAYRSAILTRLVDIPPKRVIFW